MAKARKRRYRGEAYWEQEKPVEAATERVVLSYYPQAGKLQVAATFRDRETGERSRLAPVKWTVGYLEAST